MLSFQDLGVDFVCSVFLSSVISVGGGEEKDVYKQIVFCEVPFRRTGFVVTTTFLDKWNGTEDFLLNFDPSKKHNAVGNDVNMRKILVFWCACLKSCKKKSNFRGSFSIVHILLDLN